MFVSLASLNQLIRMKLICRWSWEKSNWSFDIMKYNNKFLKTDKLVFFSATKILYFDEAHELK